MKSENWSNTTLGDFATFQRGHDLPEQERRSGDIPILGSAGIIGFHDTAIAKGPGITIGRSGSIGTVQYSPVDYWPHNTCLYVTDFHGNDEKFVYYFLKSLDFSGLNSGSVQPSLNRNFIHPLPITVPPLPEQRAIAAILGALDDKIELNRRMNRTLEEMAQLAFREWFTLNRDADNWPIGRLSDICEISIGGDWGKESEYKDSIPAICLRGVDLEELRLFGYANSAPIRWISTTSYEKRCLSNCDVLIAGSGIGPIGKSIWISPDLLRTYDFPVIYSNFVKRFHTKSPETAVFVDRYLFNLKRTNEIMDYINGTSIPNLDDKGLMNHLKLKIPNESILRKYFDFMNPIFKKLYCNESRILKDIRDSLLGKLMRGEIKTRE